MPTKTEKRPRGRPRESRDGGERLPRVVRLSDAEWSWVSEMAATAGVTAAEWVRRKVLRGYKA